MDFASNQKTQIEEMLKAIGVNSIEELFISIPDQLKVSAPTEEGMSEMEGFKTIEKIGSENTFSLFKSYLGGGAYEHWVPALVSAITAKSEFLTSYTPYQAEASQGSLQAIFEYQSCMAALLDMPVLQASVYDGASALAEAVLMAMRLNPDKKKLLLSSNINPRYMRVVNQYLHAHPVEKIVLKQAQSGQIDLEDLESKADDQVIAIVIQSPNYLGIIERLADIVKVKKQALVIQAGNPLSFGLYQTPGETGVDIAVGDTQPFGIPLQYGGPYAGYMGCKKEFIRQLPGRIAAETVDTQGRRGFVLALQTREQHIRREKATSNICTNQSLMALSTLIALLWYGKEGVKGLAKANFSRADYLKKALEKIPGVQTLSAPIFNEFWFKPQNNLLKVFEEQKIIPGIPYKEGWITAVTETKTKADLDNFIRIVSGNSI